MDGDTRKCRAPRPSTSAIAVAVMALLIGGISRPGAVQKQPAHPRTTFVELAAAVVDRHQRPIRGLQQDDFQIKDDGRAVSLTSFSEVSAAGIDGRQDGRSLVLLLDDTGIGPMGTLVVQNIARLFLSHARPADAVAVVRLTHHDDEAVGDLPNAIERVDEYQARSVPYFGRETIEEALAAVTRISRQLEPLEHRRKSLVCVGRRSLCDLFLPAPETTLVWPYWRDALTATARANVSVYLVDPAGVFGSLDLGGGLVEQTGGADFVSSNNFKRAADLIWDQTGHYYLLGYAPAAKKRDLHRIDVKVKRNGAQVLVNQMRGN
jgi:VWFA-related protein